MRNRVLTLAALLSGVAGPAAPAAETYTAAQWKASCDAFVASLDGGAVGNDLEVTYCVGQTKGIMAALRTGAQLGALSMASTLSVLYELDPTVVFSVFEGLDASELLAFCVPPDTRTAAIVLTVDRYVTAHPEKVDLPAPAAFFEALQEAFPCERVPGDDAGQRAP